MYVYSAHCLLYKSVSMYCLYVNCFCTVWSTLSRISLTKAHVLWWCDNKIDLIWFYLNCSQIPWHVCVWWLLMSWPQPQSIPCEVHPNSWIDFAWQSSYSRLVVHLFLPHFFLPLNFLLTCLDTALCEQPASLAVNVCGLSSLWRVSMIVFWTTVRSAVFPMIV